VTLSCQWSTVSLYRTLYRIPVSYPCIVSYPFCMYRILVLYPCIVSFMYKYVLRSHRIVGYQYTYKIHKIYNFSGIQLNTHLRIQSGIFEHEYTSRIRRIKHVFLNTIEYKQDTNGIRLDTILRENDTTSQYIIVVVHYIARINKNRPTSIRRRSDIQTHHRDRTDAHILTGTILRCTHSLPNFRFLGGHGHRGRVYPVRGPAHVVHDEAHEHEKRAVPLTMSS
jgi:hypothetical protein